MIGVPALEEAALRDILACYLKFIPEPVRVISVFGFGDFLQTLTDESFN